MISMSRLLLAFACLLNLALSQEEEKKDKPKPKWMPPVLERKAELDSDKDAKAANAAFGKAYGSTDSIIDKKYAIDDLAKVRHKKTAATLEKILLRDRDPVLRAHAAHGLALIAVPESEKSLLKALKARINKDEDDVLENVGIALGQIGEKSLYDDVYREFEQFGKGGKSSLILIFGYRKEKDALRLLSDWLDEPRPDNPDDPNNPPAEYWKQRFAEYHYCRDEVIWAMWRITGEVFKSKDDYREWEKKERERAKNDREAMRR